MPFTLYLAFKYLKNKILLILPLIGLILGTATLIVVHSVMKGFAVELEKIVKGLPLDITVTTNDSTMFSYKEVENKVRNIPDIDIIIPSIEMDGIIKVGESTRPVRLWALPLQKLQKRWKQYFYYFKNQKQFQKLQGFLGCHIYLPPDMSKKTKFISLLPSRITLPIEIEIKITGKFCTNLYEYDDFYVVVDLQNLQKALGLQLINKIYFQVKKQKKLRDIAEKIRVALPEKFSVNSWTYQKKTLLTAVEVERNITQLIIMLILITTGFGFGSILYILVVNKTKEIGYLKSLGASNIEVFRIFIIISLFISLAGSIAGCGIGYLFAKNINEIAQFLEKYTGFKLFPPQEYMFYSIPFYWSWDWAAFVCALNVIILVVASFLPAYKAANLNPAYTLKNE